MTLEALRRFMARLTGSAGDSPADTTIAMERETRQQVAGPDEAAAERYHLEKRLGGGGMGEVWLATDTLLGRPVAIKYLKATQDARFKELFLSEARILAQANHPNITLIYDAVFDDKSKRFYLVMEYVEGQALLDLIDERSRPMPLEEILEVAIGVLQALQYAHSKGIVHRDIKPANVILQGDMVKLTDFGVAGLISLLAEGSQQVVGTPSYMSPEQIESLPLDGRADLYSLGVMLFEMASGGRLPFEASSTVALFDAHLHTSPVPLNIYAAETPVALERVIMRLLAKKPADRYASADEALAVFKAMQARQAFSQPHLNLLDADREPLVDRVDELAQLEEVWNEVLASAQPRLLVLRGPKGIGKSRLAAEFLGRQVIDRGYVALAGMADESSGAYAPFAEILATMITRRLARNAATRPQVDQLIDQVPALARLLQISQEESPQPAAPAPGPAGAGIWRTLSSKMAQLSPALSPQAQQQLFSTVLAMLSKPGPTVILLERAASLDPESVALVSFLLRQRQLPLLILAACRDTGAAIPWLDTFSAGEKVVMTIPPLPAEAVKSYVAHLTGGPVSEVVAESVLERSLGNPLKVAEITRKLIEAKEIQPDENGLWRYLAKELEATEDAFLPRAVLGAFTRKLAQLDERSREALTMAALSEPEADFDLELWITLLGGEPARATVQKVLDQAVRDRLLREIGPGRYAFRPADVDKALIAALPETRRRDLHRQIAATLRQHQADPALIQYHEAEGG